jgi:hypothetical protein
MKKLFRMKPGCAPHTIHENGKKVVLRPGNTIFCEPGRLGGELIKFEEVASTTPEEAERGVARLLVRPRESGGFDVINPVTNKPINQAALNRDEAMAILGQPVPASAPTPAAQAVSTGQRTDDE